jgi:hypothetical protein
LQLGDLPVGEGAGFAQAAQDGVAPEFGEFPPAVRWGEVKVTVGREYIHLQVTDGAQPLM